MHEYINKKDSRLIIATGTDSGYLPKIQTYLDTIQENSNFDENWIFFVGGDHQEARSKFKVAKVNPSDCKALVPSWPCVQHGDFLTSKDHEFNPNDIIVFTDGDMFLQRPLTDTENKWLRDLKYMDISMGYNAGPNDTLLDEGARINPIKDWRKIDKVDQIPCSNGGVIACTHATYQQLYEQYLIHWPIIDEIFNHYAKGQWLISWVISSTVGFNLIRQPYTFHMHNHHPMPQGSAFNDDGLLTFEGEVVAFRHYTPYGHQPPKL